MTATEIDRLSRILTDMRVDSAAQFAILNERLSVVPGLVLRVEALEKGSRFTWSDVFKVVGAAAALVVIYVSLGGKT